MMKDALEVSLVPGHYRVVIGLLDRGKRDFQAVNLIYNGKYVLSHIDSKIMQCISPEAKGKLNHGFWVVVMS